MPPRRTLAANSMRCIPGLRFRQGEVRLHPWMTGELTCGNLHDRSESAATVAGPASGDDGRRCGCAASDQARPTEGPRQRLCRCSPGGSRSRRLFHRRTAPAPAPWLGRDRRQHQFKGLAPLASMPGPSWAGRKSGAALSARVAAVMGPVWRRPSSAWRGRSNQRRMPIGLQRRASIDPDLAEWHPSWLAFRDGCAVFRHRLLRGSVP